MKLFISILAMVLFLSCQESENLSSYDHVRDYLPLQLTKETDTIYFSDLGLYESPDSLWSDMLELTLLDSEKFVVSVNKQQALGRLYVSSSKKGEYTLPVLYSPKSTFTLAYPDGGKDLNEVRLKGEMTLWKEKPCTYNSETSQWEFTFSTLPGRFQYIFLVNGAERLDPLNPQKITSDVGTTNSLFEFAAPSKNEVSQLEHSEILEGKIRLSYTGPKPDNLLALMNNQECEVDLSDEGITVSINSSCSGFESLRVWSAANGHRSNDLNIPIHNCVVVLDPSDLPKQDPRSQIMYFVLIDRFNNGNPQNDEPVKDDRVHPMANYQGGDLQGILDKIEDGYFQDLGINAIWLSPITQNPLEAYQEYPEPHRWYTGYHGYWPIKSTKVDHRFGDDQVMKELVDKAHEAGISIYLDYICNHIHESHPVYQNNPDWGTDLYLEDSTVNIRIWEDQRLTTWFDDFLPSLDFSNPEVVEMQVDSAFYWLDQFNLDGYRHDASKHVPLEFWRSLTKKVVEEIIEPERKNVFQIGETYGARELIASYISSGKLDAQFDFPFYFDTRNILLENDQPMSNLSDVLSQSLMNFGHHHMMGNISGNHDQPRFISLAGGGLKRGENDREAGFSRKVGVGDLSGYKKLQLLQAINMAVPGIPVSYYGDEIGIPGAGDPDSRRMMRFTGWTEEEDETYQSVKKVMQFRRNSMALMYGTSEVIFANDDVLVLKRKYFEETVYACFNKGGSPEKVEIVAEDGRLERLLPAYGFEYIKNDN